MAISAADVEAIKEELREDLREEVKEELREEFSPQGRSRRDVLKMGGAALGGAALGSVGGAAGAVGPGDETLDVADVTANTYRITGNWYGGVAAARSELVSELGAADAGARYSGDDTNVWYRWDGSEWDESPPAESPNRINVRDYGAVGDGSTDDLDAFRAAAAAAEANAPAELYVPAGRYYIGPHSGEFLTIETSHVVIAGDGMYSSIIESHDDTGGDSDGDGFGDDFIIFRGTDQNNRLEGVGFQDIGYENHEGWDPVGLSMRYVDDGFCHRVHATSEYVTADAPGLPIWLGREENVNANGRLTVQDCHVVGTATNNKAIEVAGVEQAIISGNLVEIFDVVGGAESGISLVSVSEGVLGGNVVNATGASGTGPNYQLLGCRYINCTGNVSIDANTNGIAVGGSWVWDDTRHNISGNIIINPGGTGILHNSPTDKTLIQQNVITDAGGSGINFQGGSTLVGGNWIYNVGAAGITSDSAAQANGTMVFNNGMFRTTGVGIRIYSPRDKGAIISNNSISDTGGFGNNIIEVVANDGGDAVEEFVISGNIGSKASDGILIDSSADLFQAYGNRANDTVFFSGTLGNRTDIWGNQPASGFSPFMASGETFVTGDSPVSASVGYVHTLDATTGAVELDLPAAPSDRQGVGVVVTNATNTVTVDGNGNNIEGAASETLALYDAVTYRYYSGLGEWVKE